MTLPITGAGRRPEGRRGTRLGAAKGALTEWAIRRTEKASESQVHDLEIRAAGA